jgi:hypothetical protein
MCYHGVLRDMQRITYRLGKQEVVIFRLHPEVLEYRVRPEAFHQILELSALFPRSCVVTPTQLSIWPCLIG